MLSALLAVSLSATPMGFSAEIPPGPPVQVLRAGGAEASIARVQGALLAATAWSGPSGRQPGIALLTSVHRDGTGSRALFYLEPGRENLERLPDPPAQSDALAVLDLDGDGTAELLVGAPGAVFALQERQGAGPTYRKLLDAPGLGLFSPGVRPLSGSWTALAGAGRVELARPSGGDLKRGNSFLLPVTAKQEGWGLRLGSPPLHFLPGASPFFSAGPRIEGRRRLATTLLPLAGGASTEGWSRLPAEEHVAEARYARLEGRPALLVSSFERLGITERKSLRIFLPAPDRTRDGHAPVVARPTSCAVWGRLDAVLPDLDGDGRQDLLLLYPAGLRGSELRIELYAGEGGTRFAAKPRVRSLDLEPTSWAWGEDWNGDGLPDLALLADGKLHLHPGDARDHLPAPRPAWTISVAPLHPTHSFEMSFGAGDAGGPQREASQGTWAERIFELADLTGDGRPEVLATGADQTGGVRVVLVRRVQT